MNKILEYLHDNSILLFISAFISVITTIITVYFSEKIKAYYQKSIYISKAKFDVELKIYQELSESSFKSVLACSILFPINIVFIPEEPEARRKYEVSIYKKSQDAAVLFQDNLYKSSPFIKEDIANDFEMLLEKISVQNNFFYSKLSVNNFNFSLEERERATEEIIGLHKNIQNKLRNYLHSLQIEN